MDKVAGIGDAHLCRNFATVGNLGPDGALGKLFGPLHMHGFRPVRARRTTRAAGMLAAPVDEKDLGALGAAAVGPELIVEFEVFTRIHIGIETELRRPFGADERADLEREIGRDPQ